MPQTNGPNLIVYTKAVRALRAHSNPERAQVYRWYFKDPGQDVFLGVSTKEMRQVAREFRHLPLTDVRRLMRSRVHEERSLAHAILRWKFETGSEAVRDKIFRFYLRHRGTIHSWDLVDDSAPYIIGPWLLHRDKSLLFELARSPRLWDRRIAIVSTLHFIRNGVLAETLQLAAILLADREDLIHKAAGCCAKSGKKTLRPSKSFSAAITKPCPAPCSATPSSASPNANGSDT